VIKSTILALAVIAVGDALVAAPAEQRPGQTPTHVVDLMTGSDARAAAPEVPATEQLQLPFGRHGRPVDMAPQEQALTMRLIALDRAQYAIGDSLIYEVLISNRSRSAVAFPTSTDASKFSRNMRRAVGAFVGLRLDDPILGEQVVGVKALYGSPDVPQSLVVLRPGETVELRATGVWYLQSALRQPVFGPWTRDVKIRSSVQLFSNDDPPPMLVSDNVIDVRLRNP